MLRMDKSWITKDRTSNDFAKGVNEFLKFIMENANDCNSIRCPCMKCGNMEIHTIRDIKGHIYWNGFDVNYRRWIWHGESCDDGIGSSTRFGNINEEFNENDSGGKEEVAFNNIEMTRAAFDNFDNDPNEFVNLLEDAEKPLYPGCTKFTKLSALVKLYNLKAKYGYSDKSFDVLLQLLSDMLPNDNVLPTSMYDVKKTLSALGMEYTKIHACHKSCILFRKEYVDLNECPKCGSSRWKIGKNGVVSKIPNKVLWYFPIIPRFKRMFRSVETAKNLTWHANGRKVKIGEMQHPADSPS